MTPSHYRYLALIDLRLRGEMAMEALDLVCADGMPKNFVEKSRYLRLNLFNEIVDSLIHKERTK